MAEIPDAAVPIILGCIGLARYSGRLTEGEWEILRPWFVEQYHEAPVAPPIRDRENRPMPLDLLRRLLTAAAPGNASTCAECGRLVVEPERE